MLYAKGHQIDDFVIEEPIGSGGAGTVYSALQKSVNRDVALKVVANCEDRPMLKRFIREVEHMVRLEHIHILPIYSYGVVEDETAYLAMRLMRHGTLAHLLRKRGTLTLDETLRLVEQITQGLEFMHAHGTVHRDLKPSNILLDENGNGYLSDFGLAHLLNSAVSKSEHGMRMSGTPAYIAPELLQGESATAVSDVYSLGMMVYQMLCGRLPFECEHGGVAAMLYRQLREMPLQPRVLNAEIPVKVEKVMLNALAKKPQERYQSAEAFSYYLHKAAQGQETQGTGRLTGTLRRIFPPRLLPPNASASASGE